MAVEIMKAGALSSFPNPAADHVISYGENELQFGELRLPLPVPQYIVIGEHDIRWAPVGRMYVEQARHQGNSPQVINANESGHFEMIDPDSTTWPLVLQAAKAALDLE